MHEKNKGKMFLSIGARRGEEVKNILSVGSLDVTTSTNMSGAPHTWKL